MSKIVMTVATPVPDEFPAAEYDRVHHAIQRHRRNPATPRFSLAWNALVYRYVATWGHSRDFRAALGGDRYGEDKELFEFFFCGLSTVESLTYALHHVGAVVAPNKFQIADARAIKPWTTARCYLDAFPNESLTWGLLILIGSSEFAEWKDLRNVLAHGEHPGRIITANVGRGGVHARDEKSSDRWNLAHWGLPDISVDESLTSSRLVWLMGVVDALTGAAADFGDRHL